MAGIVRQVKTQQNGTDMHEFAGLFESNGFFYMKMVC